MDCLIEEQAVGGIPITIVRSCVDQHLHQSDVAVLFLLHGRKGIHVYCHRSQVLQLIYTE